MIHMVNYLFKVAVHACRRRFFSYPIWHEHPGIQYPANYSSPVYQFFQLVIIKLPVMVNECSAIVMASPNVASKIIHGLPETIVTKMRCVEDDIQPFHFL